MVENLTVSQSFPTEPLSFKAFKITFYSTILILCLVGNSAVTYIICKTKRSSIPSNLLILNLALCDLVTPTTSIPFDLALEENHYKWPFGRVLCKTLWPLATLSATSASLTLALISFERYRNIMHPFKQRLTSRQLKISIVVVHLSSALLVAPYAYHLHLVESGTKSCQEIWPDWSHRQAYTLVLFAAQYGLSLTFMIIMYTITLSNLHCSSGRFDNGVYCTRAPIFGSVDANTDILSTERSVRIRCDGIDSRKHNIRATKMFVTVVAVFAICMLPNQIYWLWSDFGDGLQSGHSNMIGIVCRMFTYMNGVFNPVIYSIYRKDFYKGFRRLWSRFKKGLCHWPSAQFSEPQNKELNKASSST